MLFLVVKVCVIKIHSFFLFLFPLFLSSSWIESILFSRKKRRENVLRFFIFFRLISFTFSLSELPSRTQNFHPELRTSFSNESSWRENVFGKKRSPFVSILFHFHLLSSKKNLPFFFLFFLSSLSFTSLFALFGNIFFSKEKIEKRRKKFHFLSQLHTCLEPSLPFPLSSILFHHP